MKLITAHVKPEGLHDLKQALCEAKAFNMSVTYIVVSGGQKGFSETYRGVQMKVNLIKKVRLEIGVNDEFVQPAIDAITKGARTGQIGDGVLFVLPVEQAMRIRSGESGGPAMG